MAAPSKHPIASRIPLLLWLGLLLPCLADAAEARRSEGDAHLIPMPGWLTLDTARRIAFQRNWDLLANQANVDIALAQKIVAREFPNPTLSVSTQKISVDSHPSGTTAGNGLWERNYDTIVAVNQLFEIGGKRASRQASAAAGVKAAEANFRDARRTLDLGVSKAYIAVLLADELAKVLRRSAETMRKEDEIAQVRFKSGDLSESDRMQIEIAAARLDLDARVAKANARTARMAVEVLLGAKKVTGAWEPKDTLGELARLAPGEGEPDARPDLLAARATVEKATADLRLQKAMRIPDPTLLLQYEHQPADQPNTVGFGISLPLPLWNRNAGAIKAAEAARTQALMQAAKIEGQIAFDIASARVAYGEATGRWKAYQADLETKSGKVLETIQFAYKKGGASLLDLFSAQRTDNEVRTAAAQAMADRAVAAVTLAAARNALGAQPKQKNERLIQQH
jgi:cobalt-zinc-cadmium efflux system outer membrane protein